MGIKTTKLLLLLAALIFRKGWRISSFDNGLIRAVGGSDHRISQLADAGNGNFDDVARHQVARRLESDADPGRRSGGDQVARLQGHIGADRLDNGADIENQV